MVDKQPTQEQTKEFWEWCGFMLEGIPNDIGFCWAYPPDGKCRKKLPPIGLKNLFKWAVPGLGFDIRFIEWVDGDFEVELLKGEHTRVATAKDKDPALALFWALRKVMKNE